MHGKLCHHYLQAGVLQLTAGNEGFQTTVMLFLCVLPWWLQASPKAALPETGPSWKGPVNRRCGLWRRHTMTCVWTEWETQGGSYCCSKTGGGGENVSSESELHQCSRWEGDREEGEGPLKAFFWMVGCPAWSCSQPSELKLNQL